MAEKPLPAPVVDLRREIATLRATQAPMIFFEAVSSLGVRNGVVNMTLDGGFHLAVDGKNVNDTQAVAHLRFPVSTMASIRAALDGIDQMLKPVPEELKN
jgi:hypothetical protein